MNDVLWNGGRRDTRKVSKHQNSGMYESPKEGTDLELLLPHAGSQPWALSVLMLTLSLLCSFSGLGTVVF